MKRLLLLPLLLLTLVSTRATNEETIIDFLNQRFGMFIHFNMGTFHGEQWAKPGHDPKSFNPRFLNCDQWAEAAESAQMSYGVFTTKHHDGFCLWDSSVTDYDVASSSYDGDIVAEYVKAFRKRGLDVGLYFSVWDRQHDIAKGKVSADDIEYTKKQLTELLTNYGEIICIVIDGWGSIWGQSPTFEDIPYNLLADHIHSIQPNCLVINHSCKSDRAYTQIVHYEATHGQHMPYDNTIPSQQGPTIQPAWFWEKGYEKLNLKPLDEILCELEFCNTHTGNYLLNAAPNAHGLMDDNVMRRLAEVGEAWVRPEPITSLPKETKPNHKVKASANMSGNNTPSNALDADLFTIWEASSEDQQPTLTLDFGRNEIFNKVICGEANSCKFVEEFHIDALVNGRWTKVAEGQNMGFHFESRFEPVKARKYRLVITKFKRTPKIAELTFVNYPTVTKQEIYNRSGESNFNRNWKFSLNNPHKEAYFRNYNDDDWRIVNLPHDWSIEHPVDSINGHGATAYLMGGLGWYRKSFTTPQRSNQRTYIVFDGVYSNTEVWINDKYVRFHPYGYSPFYIDITDYLLPYERGGVFIEKTKSNRNLGAFYANIMRTNTNVLSVKVNRDHHIDSRWYSGSGIYRNVRMVVTDNLHIPIWGTYITTPEVNTERAKVSLTVEIKNSYDDAKNATLVTQFYAPNGEIVAESNSDISIKEWSEQSVTQEVTIDNPQLWGLKTPQQYRAVSRLYMDGNELESYTTKFGIRSIKFDADKGFFLNGENMKIKGVCLHHDAGLVGAAVPKDVWERRLRTLKESGCNAIRIAHNPASDELLDLCDEIGFLVQEEFFDEWDTSKDKRLNLPLVTYDYPTRGYVEHFQEWAERDIKSVVKRGRNHPSIIQWSLGNEIEWCYINSILGTGHFGMDATAGYFNSEPPYTQEEINELYHSLIPQTYDQGRTAKKLARWTREMDTTRYITANYILPTASYESGAIECLDMVGYSYRSAIYDRGHKRMPNMPIMGTENKSSWSEWKAVLDRDFIAGIYIWTGVDYLGEAHGRGPFPKISTVSGLLDLIGEKKPTFHYIQSLWSDKPMVHFYSWKEGKADYNIDEAGNTKWKKSTPPERNSVNSQKLRRGWSYEDGERVYVEIYSNCEEVELLLNGKSLGRKSMDDFSDNRRMRWAVPFKRGKLMAIGYNNGKRVSEYSVESVGEVAEVRLEIDKHEIKANGEDVVHIIAQLYDAKGHKITDEESRKVEIKINGECQLLGVDNGDQENINPFKSTSINTYQGHALFIIQSKRVASTVEVEVVSDGLRSTPQTINIVK